MSNSQNIIFNICMDSKYKRRKKEKYKCLKNIYQLSKLKQWELFLKLGKDYNMIYIPLYSACYQVYERKIIILMK